MTAADVTDFFLTLCERADNNVNVAVDALAAGEAVGIHAPTVFAHVNELKGAWLDRGRPAEPHGWAACASQRGGGEQERERTVAPFSQRREGCGR